MKAYRLAAGDDLLPTQTIENEGNITNFPIIEEDHYDEEAEPEPEYASHSVHSQISSRDALNIGYKLKLRILTGKYTNTEVDGEGLEGFAPTMTKVDMAYRSPKKGEYVQSLTCDDGHGIFESHGKYTGMLDAATRQPKSKISQKDKEKNVQNVRFLPKISTNKRSVFNNTSNKPSDEEIYKRALDAPDEDLVKWGMTLDYEAYNTNWAGLASSLPSDFDFHHSNVGVQRDK